MNIIELFPEFEKNIHYKEYSPLEGGYKYRFVTIHDIEFRFLHRIIPRGQKILFKDAKGKIWMTIFSNKVIISKGYAWDGCTPKKWWGIWWGVPDFKKTALASLLHDALIQFQHTKHSQFNRYEIDNYFKFILKDNEFVLSELYYIGVRIGSKFSDKKYNVYSELTYIPPD